MSLPLWQKRRPGVFRAAGIDRRHLMADARCSCGTNHVQDARVRARRDPTQTIDLRRAMMLDLDRRWRAVSRLVTEAVYSRDMFGLGTPSAGSVMFSARAGGKVRAFQDWLDEATNELVLGRDPDFWVGRYVSAAFARGWRRAAGLVRHDVPVGEDRDNLLVGFAVAELEGVREAVSQQAVRAFSDGLLSREHPREVARQIRRSIVRVGVVRSRATAQAMIVRAHAEATLDVFELARVRFVGLVPETVPVAPRRVVQDRYEESEHPRAPDGKWIETGSGSSKEIVAYHGSSSKVAQSIGRSGLKISVRRNHSKSFYKDERGRSVYVASTKQTALNYAYGKPDVGFGADAVVLEVRIPKKEWGSFRTDLQHGEGAAYRTANIPAKWIKSYEVYDSPHARKMNLIRSEKLRDEALSTDSEDVTIYVVVMVPRGEASDELPAGLLFFDARRRRRRRAAPDVELASIITAGDDDVCDECEALAENGPYEVDEARAMLPAHPFCRCAWIPYGDERYAGDAQWEEEKHPRAPAGNERGGEFTSGGGGSTSSAAPKGSVLSRSQMIRLARQDINSAAEKQYAYHGTPEKNLGKIFSSGRLKPAQGNWNTDLPAVHFSNNPVEAVSHATINGDGALFRVKTASVKWTGSETRSSLQKNKSMPISGMQILTKTGWKTI